nr:MAG TPA: hypothetical protein [Caudoviricetes sp.]
MNAGDVLTIRFAWMNKHLDIADISCCFISHKTLLDCCWPCPAASFPHEYFKFHSGYRPRDP